MKNFNRRSFLKAVGHGVGGGSDCRSPNGGGQRQFRRLPEQHGVLVDFTRCVAAAPVKRPATRAGAAGPDKPLTTCLYDERQENGQQRRTTEKAYTVVNRYEQTDRRAARSSASSSATTATNRLPDLLFRQRLHQNPRERLTYNSKVCVGCRTCMVACPFYVRLQLLQRHQSADQKCIMCYDTRLKFGRPPAVSRPAPGVMTFGHRADLINLGHERIRNNPGKYVDHITGKRRWAGTAWMYMSDVPFEQIGFNTSLVTNRSSPTSRSSCHRAMVLTIWPPLHRDSPAVQS